MSDLVTETTPATIDVRDGERRGSGLVRAAIGAIERGWVPDLATRWGIRRLCRSGLAARAGSPEAEAEHLSGLLQTLRTGPIAMATDSANEQHYELPPEFFELVLGRYRKYSGCYWPAGATTLDEAEAASLEQICERAGIRDGIDVLELGCGWGSLSLWMAERYPNARITAVSNSALQRRYIEGIRDRGGLGNLQLVTADMNVFDPGRQFDRVVSIEMFEHMRNYQELMARIASWLRPDGALFVHIFVHAQTPYLFEVSGPSDWITRHFFAGGVMPSDGLLHHFQDDLRLAQRWRLGGDHYRRTAEAWLANLDAHRERVEEIFARVYGPEAASAWVRRWRVFFMACAEMFGYANGREWWIGHYRFARR